MKVDLSRRQNMSMSLPFENHMSKNRIMTEKTLLKVTGCGTLKV